MQRAKKSRGPSEVTEQEVEEAFSQCDDGSGFVSIKRLKVVMRALGFEPRQEEVDRYVEKMQNNEAARAVNKDAFTLEELLHVIKDKLENEDRNREIHSAFELFDTDGKGYIGYDDLKRVSDELGENLKKEELWEMLREADKTSRGRVTEEDFKDIMKKTALY